MFDPENPVPRTVTFIRHAETTANAQRRWQGSSNAPFTDTGRDQIARLRARFADHAPRRLIASDLPRTMHTSQALGNASPDPAWREFDVGAWEGLTSDEVDIRFPGELPRLFSGDDFAIGGAERMSAFRVRIDRAFDDLVDDLVDEEEAVVVTHGGVIWAVVNRVLGASEGAVPVIPSHNTAVTRVRVFDDGGLQLTVFNDASHLDTVPTQFGPSGTHVTLFRHGQTEGNVSGRWQGRSDSALTELGLLQVANASAIAPGIDALYSSPLGRTMHTARIISEGAGVPAVPHDGLVEMSFGAWEDMTSAEAAAQHPALFEALYGRGEDHPRGGDGESFTGAGERLAATLSSLVQLNGSSSLGAVSHGAVIRAYAVHIVGLSFAERDRFPVPRNSSMTGIVYTEGRPMLASYNVAPHMDHT